MIVELNGQMAIRRPHGRLLHQTSEHRSLNAVLMLVGPVSIDGVEYQDERAFERFLVKCPTTYV
jgi:hypothetical protein